MVDESDNYVYVVEGDPAATSSAIRRLRVLFLAAIPVLLAAVGLVAVVAWLDGRSPSLFVLLQAFLVIPAIGAVIVYLIVPRCVKKADVMMGGDFILAPAMTWPKYMTVMKYKDIRRVTLDVSKGRIVGAAVATRLSAAWIGRITEPAVVVRAIFERAPDKVKWYRSWPPLRSLSREAVWELLKKAQAPEMNRLLPPSATWAQAESLFSRHAVDQRGFLARLFARAPARSVKAVTWQTPTAANQYVGFMLLQMFEAGQTTRILKQSEPLPVLTLQADTAEPPPLEEVLDHLTTMSGLDPRANAKSPKWAKLSCLVLLGPTFSTAKTRFAQTPSALGRRVLRTLRSPWPRPATDHRPG